MANANADKDTAKKIVYEARVRFQRPEDRRLFEMFEEICDMTHRSRNKVIKALIDDWVREEGTKLFGADTVASRLDDL